MRVEEGTPARPGGGRVAGRTEQLDLFERCAVLRGEHVTMLRWLSGGGRGGSSRHRSVRLVSLAVTPFASARFPLFAPDEREQLPARGLVARRTARRAEDAHELVGDKAALLVGARPVPADAEREHGEARGSEPLLPYIVFRVQDLLRICEVVPAHRVRPLVEQHDDLLVKAPRTKDALALLVAQEAQHLVESFALFDVVHSPEHRMSAEEAREAEVVERRRPERRGGDETDDEVDVLAAVGALELLERGGEVGAAPLPGNHLHHIKGEAERLDELKARLLERGADPLFRVAILVPVVDVQVHANADDVRGVKRRYRADRSVGRERARVVALDVPGGAQRRARRQRDRHGRGHEETPRGPRCRGAADMEIDIGRVPFGARCVAVGWIIRQLECSEKKCPWPADLHLFVEPT